MRATIPFWEPRMGAREKQLICDVIDSGFPNDGDVTADFERRVASFLGVPHAVAVTSGTTAITLGLMAMGVKPGDEVIVPDVTFIATANAVSLAGAVPVLVDVSTSDLCIDPAAVDAAITPRTKAIVPVHVSGRSALSPKLVAIARDRGIPILEDAAEALGSRTSAGAIGTHAAAGTYSLTANKTITTGQGGIVVTRDPALYRRLRELKDQGRPERGTGGDDTHVSLGYNFKFTNLQAAMGIAQLEDLPVRLRRLKEIAAFYRDELGGRDWIRLVPFALDEGESPQWIDAWVPRRDELFAALASHGIHGRKFWHPLHTQAPYAAPAARFPNASLADRHAMWLPSAFTLTDDDLHRVCDATRAWARSAGLEA